MSTGKLEGATVYLSGAMEFAADHGVGWRRQFIELVRRTSLKIDCIDPTNKPGGVEGKIGENKSHQEKLQSEGRWEELKKYVASYRRYDLRFVDISDFLIAAITPDIPQWGTSNEIYVAEQQHKPIFFIVEGGLSKMPRWLFDIITLEDKDKGIRSNVFANVDDVINELILMDSGLVPMSDEWVLVRKHIERNRYQV